MAAILRSERMISLYREIKGGLRHTKELEARFAGSLSALQVKRAHGSLRNRGFIEWDGKWRVKR